MAARIRERALNDNLYALLASRFPADRSAPCLLLADGAVREVRHLPNSFPMEKPYRYG